MIHSIQQNLDLFWSKINPEAIIDTIQEKGTAITLLVDNLPFAVNAALNLVPVVNIFAHYLKEKGLTNRVPDIKKYEITEIRYRSIEKDRNLLQKRIEDREARIQRMQNRREFIDNRNKWDFEAQGSLKERARRAFIELNAPTSKIERYEAEVAALNKRMTFLEEHLDEVSFYRTLYDLIPDENREDLVERSRLRTIFRSSIFASTIVAVVLVALAALSVINFGWTIPAILIASAGFATHLAICKCNQWHHDGQKAIDGD